MAHMLKATRGSLGGLTRHYERAVNPNGEYIKFSNQDIDVSRTHLNYNLAPDRAPDRGSQIRFVNQICEDLSCLKRKDVKIMVSWVITRPKDLSDDEAEVFFRECYSFLCDRYGGEEYVISSTVHRDESTDHIHHAFVPVYEDPKKGKRVNCNKVVTRRDLQTFHRDLSAHMERVFGRDVGVETGITKANGGNKSIAELKAMDSDFIEYKNALELQFLDDWITAAEKYIEYHPDWFPDDGQATARSKILADAREYIASGYSKKAHDSFMYLDSIGIRLAGAGKPAGAVCLNETYKTATRSDVRKRLEQVRKIDNLLYHPEAPSKVREAILQLLRVEGITPQRKERSAVR